MYLILVLYMNIQWELYGVPGWLVDWLCEFVYSYTSY